MIINFLVNDVAYMDYKNLTAIWGWEPTDKRLGGTEESVVKWGEELVKRGHQVSVFRNSKKQHTYNGVHYIPTDKYGDPNFHQVADICINVKSSHIEPHEPTLYLTNETDVTETDLSNYLGVIWPSQWAVNNIPVNNKTFILPHGYDQTKIYPGEKVPKRCLYSSSPDRGFETIEQIWPTIVEFHPDAELYVSYGARTGLPNSTSGEFTEDEMDELYRTSDIWLHPCTGGELYGISGVKAQAAGAIPVYFPTMALTETIKAGVVCFDARDMFKKLNDLLADDWERGKLRQQLASIHQPTWQDSTDILLKIINKVLK